MLFKRHKLFRFFGFDVQADGSWLFLIVLLGWSLVTHIYPQLLPGQPENTYQIMAIATLAGLFASIIAHEVAHAVIAQHYKMPILGITLFMFGGVAELKGEPSHPKGEFLMAIAGPAMSVLAGLVFSALSNLAVLPVKHNALQTCLAYLGYINFMIAAANMVPAFPLDGGRALRALLWARRKNLVEATRDASKLGSAFAYGLLGYACYLIVIHDNMMAGMWYGLFGLFLHGSAEYAVRQTEGRTILGNETVRRFVTQAAVTVPSHLTIADFVDRHVAQHYQRNFAVVDNDRLMGLITVQTVLGLPREKWPWLYVSSLTEAMSPANTVPPDFSAAEALDLMQRQGRESLLVADGQSLIGIVALRDLMAYLSISSKVDQDRPVKISR